MVRPWGAAVGAVPTAAWFQYRTGCPHGNPMIGGDIRLHPKAPLAGKLGRRSSHGRAKVPPLGRLRQHGPCSIGGTDNAFRCPNEHPNTAKRNTNFMMSRLVIIAIAGLWLVACQSDRGTGEAEVAELEQAPVVEEEQREVRRRYQPRERPERERARDTEPVPLEGEQRLTPRFTEGRLNRDGPGLSLMIDASSVDAFHQSLELIASETSQAQYRHLRSAVEMLEFYDFDAGSGPDGVLQTIDGMTGEQIIERARQIRSR